MIPYASLHGRRYRVRRFVPNRNLPRFAYSVASGIGVKDGRVHSHAAGTALDARTLRLLAMHQGLRPLPPMTGERRWSVPRRWRHA